MKTEGSLPCSEQRQMIWIHIHLRRTCDVCFTSNITVLSTSTASVLFPEGFRTKTLYEFFLSVSCCLYVSSFFVCSSHYFSWSTNIKFVGKFYGSNCLPFPVTFSLSFPGIIFQDPIPRHHLPIFFL
jgi:hypothetical protein